MVCYLCCAGWTEFVFVCTCPILTYIRSSINNYVKPFDYEYNNTSCDIGLHHLYNVQAMIIIIIIDLISHLLQMSKGDTIYRWCIQKAEETSRRLNNRQLTNRKAVDEYCFTKKRLTEPRSDSPRRKFEILTESDPCLTKFIFTIETIILMWISFEERWMTRLLVDGNLGKTVETNNNNNTQLITGHMSVGNIKYILKKLNRRPIIVD